MSERAYLICGRKKGWNTNIPPFWVETAWERFDYVECGVFEKNDPLTDDDRAFLERHAEKPEGWIEPTTHAERDAFHRTTEGDAS